jgi:RNA polymerase sigma factor (sigma-70 family)
MQPFHRLVSLTDRVTSPARASSDTESDDALLNRLARTGDARAFELLYHRHTRPLYATAVRLTRDPDAAADIVHDAWVRAVESLDRFEHRSTLRTWLTGILVNCYRERERARHREAPDDDVSIDDVIDPTQACPLDGSRLDRIDLDAAIEALPPRFRQVLVLHDIEGFTHEEIAAMLGLVPGTSKSQLARARCRVRALLETGIPRPTP